MTQTTEASRPNEDVRLGPPVQTSLDLWSGKFRDDLAVDSAFESSLLTKELLVMVIIALLVMIREVLL